MFEKSARVTACQPFRNFKTPFKISLSHFDMMALRNFGGGDLSA